MVVFSHGIYFNPGGPKIYGVIARFAGLGWMGVPIFFVLSAFLVSLPFFRGRQKNPRFWRHPGYVIRRALKILPPFYMVTIILILLLFWHNKNPQMFTLGFVWATGIAHFVPFPPLNGPYWSLWVEIGFYVVLPFFFLSTRGADFRKTGWSFFLVMIIVPFVSRSIMWKNPAEYKDWAFLMSRFPNSLDIFAWGLLFSTWYLSKSQELERWKPLARLGYAGLVTLVIAGLVQVFRLRDNNMPERLDIELNHLLPGISAFLMLFFAFDQNCFGNRFFSSHPMRFVGAVSYEWFLIHVPIYAFFRNFLPGAHGSLLHYVLTVTSSTLCSFILAVLIYHYFSLPVMRWGRSKNSNAALPKLQTQPASQPQ